SAGGCAVAAAHRSPGRDRIARARSAGRARGARDRRSHLAALGESRWTGNAAGTGVTAAAHPFDASLAPTARPLAVLPRTPDEAHLRAALAAEEGAAGAHCIHELWMRGEFAANIEAALAALWRSAARSIPEWLPMHYIEWLPTLYEVTHGFRATRRGRYNLYL